MTDKQEKPKTTKDEILMVYTGEHDGQYTATLHGFLEIDPVTHYPVDFNREFLAKRKPKYCSYPGTVIKVEVAHRNEIGHFTSLYLTSATIQGTIKNKDIRETYLIDWQVQTRARREAKAKIKDAQKDVVVENLERIRLEYLELSPARKKAFLAYVLTYMTRV